MLALSEARAQGADDALMLNTRGTIACASAANLFIIRDGRLETPPIGDGALPGTMRALVLSMAKQAGLAPVETSLAISSLAAADHVFLTNSLSRLTEAGHCDGVPLQRRAAPHATSFAACLWRISRRNSPLLRIIAFPVPMDIFPVTEGSAGLKQSIINQARAAPVFHPIFANIPARGGPPGMVEERR